MENQVSIPRGPNSRSEVLKVDKRAFRKGPSRGRSLSPSSRGRDEAQLAGSRSATRILPAGTLSPTAEHRRSLSRASSRREKSRERADNADFAAEAVASLEDNAPLGLQGRHQPSDLLPEQILYRNLSFIPLKELDLSDWTEHIWPSELQRILRLNSSWDTLRIIGCDSLDDAQVSDST